MELGVTEEAKVQQNDKSCNKCNRTNRLFLRQKENKMVIASITQIQSLIYSIKEIHLSSEQKNQYVETAAEKEAKK